MINNTGMKILAQTAQWVFVFCLPVLLLTAGISWAVNSHWLYRSGFQKYDVSQSTGLEEVELNKVATGLIHYFNSAEEYINLTMVKDGKPFELFTQEEKFHFRDVKKLFRLDYLFFLGTLIYILVYSGISFFWRKRLYWQRLAWGVAGGSGITLALMLFLGIGSVVNFNWLFLQFHLISFANEFWSTEGYMLLLFPEDFWYDTTILCAIITTGLAVVLGGISGSYLLFTRRNTGTPNIKNSKN